MELTNTPTATVVLTKDGSTLVLDPQGTRRALTVHLGSHRMQPDDTKIPSSWV